MRIDRRRRRARTNTRREWSLVPDEPPSLSAWRQERQALNRLITASPDPFSLQDDSQVLTREQSPGASLCSGPAVSATDLAPPPGVLTPAPAAFANRGIVTNIEGFRFIHNLPRLYYSACASQTGSPGGPGFPVSLAVVRFGLYEAAPLHSVSWFGVCGKSYDEERRKGVGSNGLRLDDDFVTRFQGCPGSAGESPDYRFLVGR